jgi:hypothetical protein
MPSISPRSPSSRNGRLRARDAGLRRVSVVTRTVVAASVAAAAGFTGVAAWAQPGRAKTVDPNRTLGAGSTTPATTPPTSGSDDSPSGTVPATTPTTFAPVGNDGTNTGDTLAPPDTLPDPGYSYSPPVVSGAS